jgi:hypothetical protein
MWYCIVGWVGPNSTKEHGAFIFREPSSLPGLLARHEGTVILWNIRKHPPNSTLAHARRHHLWEPHISKFSVAWNNTNDYISNLNASQQLTQSLCNTLKKKCELQFVEHGQHSVPSHTGLTYIQIPQIQYIFVFSDSILSFMKDLFYFLIKTMNNCMKLEFLSLELPIYFVLKSKLLSLLGCRKVITLTQRYDPQHPDPHKNCREKLILGSEVWISEVCHQAF